MDQPAWILLTVSLALIVINVWWFKRRFGMDVIKEFRRELKRPQAIRTSYLVLLAVALVGWTLLSLAWFTFSVENVIFLAVYLTSSILVVRAVFRRRRQRESNEQAAPPHN